MLICRRRSNLPSKGALASWLGRGAPHREFSQKALARVRGFWREEQGQDLIEYSLLLAFICLSGAAMYIGMGQTTSGIWSIVNNRLAAANQSS